MSLLSSAVGMTGRAASAFSAPGMHMAGTALGHMAAGGIMQAAAGAMIGGAAGSYYRGGGTSGAVRGAFAGAAAGAGLAAMPRMMRAGAPMTMAYSSNITRLASGMETREGRTALIGSGSLLAGFAFGGNRSLKRGFNASRGNSIGR